MADPIRKDWIIPVLEDIRNFLQETGQDAFALDIETLIARYEPDLRSGTDEVAPDDDASNVIDLSARRTHA